MHDSMKRLHQVTGLIRKKDIADALGVAQSTATNWGTRGVSKDAAMKAAKLYNVDARYILEGVPAMTGDPALDLIRQNNFNIAGGEDHRHQIPVLTKISKDVHNRSTDDGWIEQPLFMSDRAFALIIDNRGMMPMFNIGDYAIVEPDITKEQLRDGDYVVAQHKLNDCGVVMMVMVYSYDDIRYVQTNSALASIEPQSSDDYTLFGIVDRRVTKFR